MKYSDGNIAKIRDLIAIDTKYRGLVVACIDSDEYSEEYPRNEWSYLLKGIMVDADFGGLVYYQDEEVEHITLIERNCSNPSLKRDWLKPIS